MKDREILNFFKILKNQEWNIYVNKKWKVKDVLSHLVGWEREVANGLLGVFEEGKEPWFVLTDDYSKFNDKIYKEYKNYSPKELIKELDKREKILEDNIKRIGENEIRKKGNISWVFDEGKEPHFKYHLKQINKAIKLKKTRKRN